MIINLSITIYVGIIISVLFSGEVCRLFTFASGLKTKHFVHCFKKISTLLYLNIYTTKMLTLLKCKSAFLSWFAFKRSYIMQLILIGNNVLLCLNITRLFNPVLMWINLFVCVISGLIIALLNVIFAFLGKCVSHSCL